LYGKLQAPVALFQRKSPKCLLNRKLCALVLQSKLDGGKENIYHSVDSNSVPPPAKLIA
jgi:hypothetical protein